MNSLQQPQQEDPDPDVEEQTATDEDDGDGEPPSQIPLDVVFGILKNERRRLVLEFLAETEEQTSLSDLAEHIASIENDKPANELGSQERKRVYVGLYQCHLPRMHDSGAIDFDKNRGTVAPGQNIEQFYEYLDRPEPDPRPWSKYYLGFAGLSGAAVAGTLLIYQALSTVAVSLAILGFVALAVLHTVSSGQ